MNTNPIGLAHGASEEHLENKTNLRELNRHFSNTRRVSSEDIVRDEDRQIGKVTFAVFKTFIKYMGGPIMITFSMTICMISQTLSTLFNKCMEDFGDNFNKDNTNYFLVGLIVINIAMVIFFVLSGLINVFLNRKISLHLHSAMAFCLLHAKIQGFLESVSYGQIQNRFSKDVTEVDQSSNELFYLLSNNVANLIVFCGFLLYLINWVIFISIAVCFFLVYKLQDLYMICKTEYKRLQAISSSPIISNCSDIISGLPYIRNMNLAAFFRKKYLDQVTEKLKNDLFITTSELWFSLRCNLAMNIIVILPCIVLIVFFSNTLNAANIGLFTLIADQMTRIFISAVDVKTEMETFLVSVERCEYFAQLQPEKGYKNYEMEKTLIGKGTQKDYQKLAAYEKESGASALDRRNVTQIVTRGRIRVSNLTARYLSSKTDVIHHISFGVRPGQKVGIVGRSGSGKSTIIKLLWRYMKPRKGYILLDGEDISKADIKTLRSQITVITQETALFNGTLRYNLDPTEFTSTDDEMMNFLERLEFENAEFKKYGLDMKLDSEGTNLSQGEKQLVCFCRAALRANNLVLLDEATASIDIKTERAIQRMIKEEFKKKTMIIVAHRVNTVMECDKIIVMKDGKIEAKGSPEDLMKTSDFFSDIVQKMKEQ